jgi:hypothetical protein
MSLKICFVYLFSGALFELLFVLHKDALFHNNGPFFKSRNWHGQQRCVMKKRVCECNFRQTGLTGWHLNRFLTM